MTVQPFGRYEIDAEVGRVAVFKYGVMHGSMALYNPVRRVLPQTYGRERLASERFRELMLFVGAKVESMREGCNAMNRFLNRRDGDRLSHRTFAANIESEGQEVMGYIEHMADAALGGIGFGSQPGAALKNGGANLSGTPPALPGGRVEHEVETYNATQDKDMRIDETQLHEAFVADADCVNISVDDVGVVKQKEHGRTKAHLRKEHRSYVQNTVVHVQHGDSQYTINGVGIKETMRLLLAFLATNELLEGKELVFFADGAGEIKEAVREVFGWRPYRLILDWYHLEKKCQERLSMGMKGRDNRNAALAAVLPQLWLGKVDAAVDCLKSLPQNAIKDTQHIGKLADYIQRHYSSIPCYALRKRLGLRNSSNRGEKSNDLLVARRQKHNGMSWSRAGSSGMAAVCALLRNNELENWVRHRSLAFALQYDPVSCEAVC